MICATISSEMEVSNDLRGQKPLLSFGDGFGEQIVIDGRRAEAKPVKGVVPKRRFTKPPVKNACLPCRASRIRCDGQLPCANCTEKHKSCKYEKSRRGGPRLPSNKKRLGDNATLQMSVMKQEPSPPLTLEDQYVAADTLKDAGAGLRLLDELIDDGAIFPPAILDPNFDACNPVAWDDCHLAKMPEVQGDLFFMNQANAEWDATHDFSFVGTEGLTPPEVRAYGNEADLLDAYYVWIHAYFPVLPPPIRSPIVDQPLQYPLAENRWVPDSPLTLAISAILSLIPLPTDPNSRTLYSTEERRRQAHTLATRAMEVLDNDAELLDSTINPKDALSNGPAPTFRKSLHPQVPVELETNITLMLLAVYEYTQRGNIKKMMNRGGQSLMSALEAKLYAPKPGYDEFAEARRRVWWATYINVCQGSIASNTSVAVDLHDKRFTIEYPTILSDPEAFPFFIKCQQAIVDATQYVIDHTEILERGGDLDIMNQRTLEMEDRLAALGKTADEWFAYDRYAVDMPVDYGEAVVAKALRAIARMKINSARIKLHRYSAFIDKPIFQKRHCDLQTTAPLQSPASNLSGSMSSSNFSGTGGSTSTADTPLSSDNSYKSDPNTSSNATATPNNEPWNFNTNPIQPMCNLSNAGPQSFTAPANGRKSTLFSSDYSTKICCKAALDIAETFAVLPYPNPTGILRSSNPVYNPADPLNPANLTPSNYATLGPSLGMGNMGFAPFGTGLDLNFVAKQQQAYPPRTMPTFACCAMQSAYALLMLLYKVYVAKAQNGMEIEGPLGEHVEKLREGLAGVAAALENWAGAFEAIDGMREEVANALEFNVVQFDGLERMGCGQQGQGDDTFKF